MCHSFVLFNSLKQNSIKECNFLTGLNWGYTWSAGASSSHLQLKCSGTSYGYPGDFISPLPSASITLGEPEVQAEN